MFAWRKETENTISQTFHHMTVHDIVQNSFLFGKNEMCIYMNLLGDIVMIC